MIGTLTFTLPEEQAEYHAAVFAGAMASALDEIRRTIRDLHKYESQSPADALLAIQEIVIEALAWEEI